MTKLSNIIIGLICTTIIGVILIVNLPSGKLLVSFLDIGQGDAIYIRTPDDYHLLIDAGPSSSVLEEMGETVPLYNRTIDLIFLSHPHADHVNGFVEVVKRNKIGGAVIVGTPSRNQFYQKLLQLLHEQNVPVYFARADRDIKVGRDVYIDIIWPEKNLAGVHFENVNNASLAMRVLYKDSSVLLTGDAEVEEENEILQSGFELGANVFKAGHHGSRTASSVEFLEAVKPETAVIQSGIGNSYLHPHKETLQNLYARGVEVLRTDLSGRINLEFF